MDSPDTEYLVLVLDLAPCGVRGKGRLYCLTWGFPLASHAQVASPCDHAFLHLLCLMTVFWLIPMTSTGPSLFVARHLRVGTRVFDFYPSEGFEARGTLGPDSSIGV